MRMSVVLTENCTDHTIVNKLTEASNYKLCSEFFLDEDSMIKSALWSLTHHSSNITRLPSTKLYHLATYKKCGVTGNAAGTGDFIK